MQEVIQVCSWPESPRSKSGIGLLKTRFHSLSIYNVWTKLALNRSIRNSRREVPWENHGLDLKTLSKKNWDDKNIRVSPTYKISSNTGRANELFIGNSRKKGSNPRLGFIPHWATSQIAPMPRKMCPLLIINCFLSLGNEELQIINFYRRATSRKDTSLASPASACHRPTSTTTAPTAEWWCPNSEASRPRPTNELWKSSRRPTGPITKWSGWAHARSFWMPATSIALPSSILRAGERLLTSQLQHRDISNLMHPSKKRSAGRNEWCILRR